MRPRTPKELREAKGLTQAQAADQIGMSRSYYNEIENGGRVPSYKKAAHIAAFYGVGLHEIRFPAYESAERETDEQAAALDKEAG